MCRSIKVLRDTEPAATEDIEAAALQFVRKISGMRKPSRRNEEAFYEALKDITTISQHMLSTMDLKPLRPLAEPPAGANARVTTLRTRRPA